MLKFSYLNKSRVLLLSLCVALLFCAGCVQIEGEEGNLTFRYLNSVLVGADRDGDIAVGAKVDIKVYDARNSSGPALHIYDAFSDDAQTLDVVRVEENSFTVEALDESLPEGTRIHAEATDEDGAPLADALSIRTAVVSEIEIEACDEDAVYLTESRARFTYRMRDAAGSRLTGYGYYPLTIEPIEGGTVDADTGLLELLEIHTGDTPGTYDFNSDLDGTNHSFELIDPADIDAIRHVAEESPDDDDTGSIGDVIEPDEEVDVGEKSIVAAFLLESQGRLVCPFAERAFEITTETPEICEPSYDMWWSLHIISAEGKAEGTCQINYAIVDTDLEETLTVQIVAAEEDDAE